MKILPFRRLGDCLGVGNRVIDGLTYHFDVWDTRAPLSLSSDDMFFVIPIIEIVHPGQKKRLRKYELVRLLFQRTNSFEQWGDWGFHKLEFSRQYPNNPGMGSQYVSSASEIVMCKDDRAYLDHQLGKLNLPLDFIKIVEGVIGKWVMETIEKRGATLKILEDLQHTFAPSQFVLKYVLPSGEVVGYIFNPDFLGNFGAKKVAKVYSSQDASPDVIIRTISERFKTVWMYDDQLKTRSFWEGASLEDIKIVAEAV